MNDTYTASDVEGMMAMTDVKFAQLDRLVAELRAVLAPLLDEPRRDVDGPCVFCGEYVAPHASDCPTLEPRKSELLGR